MSTKDIPEGHEPAPLLGLGSSEGLGLALERESFERTMRQWAPSTWTFQDDGTGGYHNHYTELAWIAWQSRGPEIANARELVDSERARAVQLRAALEYLRRSFADVALNETGRAIWSWIDAGCVGPFPGPNVGIEPPERSARMTG